MRDERASTEHEDQTSKPSSHDNYLAIENRVGSGDPGRDTPLHLRWLREVRGWRDFGREPKQWAGMDVNGVPHHARGRDGGADGDQDDRGGRTTRRAELGEPCAVLVAIERGAAIVPREQRRVGCSCVGGPVGRVDRARDVHDPAVRRALHVLDEQEVCKPAQLADEAERRDGRGRAPREPCARS